MAKPNLNAINHSLNNKPVPLTRKGRRQHDPKKRSIKAIDKSNGTPGQLHQLAFDNSSQANIISVVSSGKIILANQAACKLLGYSSKELLLKYRSGIFDIHESAFIKMLRERTVEGHSSALVTAIKKNGKSFSCQVTSAVFIADDGIEKSITTIADISQNILNQKNIDAKKEKAVADNIILAKEKQKKIDVKNKRVVANNIVVAISKQKNLDTKKKKTVANNILLAREKQNKIDIKKEQVVFNNIVIAHEKQKEIDTKKEKIVAANIVLAKSRQKTIDTKKKKMVKAGIIKAAARLHAQVKATNKWIKYISETSYDVMWDWDIVTGKVYVGGSLEEVFGHKMTNNKINLRRLKAYILPAAKDTSGKKLRRALASDNKTWNDSYMVKRRDGSMASATSRANIVRNEKGNAIRLIGATQDVSKLVDLEKKLKDQITTQTDLGKIFHVASNLSFDGIWDWNLVTGEFFLGDGFEELFGYEIRKNKGNKFADWSNYLHPEDKEAVEKGLKTVIDSSKSYWEDTYRFVKADGSIARVFNRASIIRNDNGKAYRIIGAMQDISKQKVLEEKLEREIKLKDSQIADASELARRNERSDIGRELHDNVNQLLGASRMYLNMSKRGGEDSEMYLNRSSEYTLTAIEEIRKLTKVLTTDAIKTLGLCESIENISRDIMLINPLKIYHKLETFIEESVDDKFKLNIFRIVQEGLNNILKHSQATDVYITLSQNKKNILLSISDNGIGFNTKKKNKGIGVSNIISRTEFYKGTANFISQPGKGCSLAISFPVKVL